MKNVFSGIVGVGGNERMSLRKLDPSLQSLFVSTPFTKGVDRTCYPKKKTVVFLNVKFCRVSDVSLNVLEMLKLLT